jgi:hypothetical protein
VSSAQRKSTGAWHKRLYKKIVKSLSQVLLAG